MINVELFGYHNTTFIGLVMVRWFNFPTNILSLWIVIQLTLIWQEFTFGSMGQSIELQSNMLMSYRLSSTCFLCEIQILDNDWATPIPMKYLRLPKSLVWILEVTKQVHVQLSNLLMISSCDNDTTNINYQIRRDHNKNVSRRRNGQRYSKSSQITE